MRPRENYYFGVQFNNMDESKKKLGEEELMKVNGGSSDADSEEKSAYDPENTYPCNQVIPPWITPTPPKPTDDD